MSNQCYRCPRCGEASPAQIHTCTPRLDLMRPRVLQIRRAHASAKPKDTNPAWKNSHVDMAYLLDYIDALEVEIK